MAERASIAVLVSSALVELVTGFFNVLNWYPWPWSFVPVHRFLGYVLIGSILLHIAVKLPDIKYGLRAPLARGDVLTEVPWEQNPDAYSNNADTHVDPPRPAGISRRGVLTAAGAGIGLVVVTTVGQTHHPAARHRPARGARLPQGPGRRAGQPHRRPGQGRALRQRPERGACSSPAPPPA